MTITLSPQQDDAIKSFAVWYKALPERRFTHTEIKYSPDGDAIETPVYSRGLDEGPFFLLNGFAGTGKSTVLPFLVESTGLNPHQIAFCAPTGKAAKVMTRKLRDQGMNDIRATTIHKAIYRPKALKAFQIEQDLFATQKEYKIATESGDGVRIRELKSKLAQIEKNLERAYDENSPAFQLDVDSPTAGGAWLIVVDECSMVDKDMADDLASFGVPILAIGDPGQLPPISPAGPGFCFREPDALLSEIHRQALDNPIIWASMRIREGHEVPMGSHGDGLLRVVDRDDDDVTFDLDRDAQVIVGTHEKRWQITRKLRKLCGHHGLGPASGELMMITRNSRLYPDLVNGSVVRMRTDVGALKGGAVTFVGEVEDEDEKEFTLKCLQATIEEHYRGKNDPTAHKRDVFRAKQDERTHELDFAYAITCHKSQGSQWDEVVVHDQSNVFRKDASRWLYTAVTRAAKKLTIVV
jgi:exodeoxyribonuclease-5